MPSHEAAGVNRTAKGYKLHAIYSGNPMPDAFVITTLNVCEKQIAARMIGRVEGCGYLLGDNHDDARWLYDHCHFHCHQMVSPRARPGNGRGHHYLSAHRRRAIEMPEVPAAVNLFGNDPYDRRTGIERDFLKLICFGAGLGPLPTWVHRIWRVWH